jgi:DNA repair exonuclease SbcCD ATPase subunit
MKNTLRLLMVITLLLFNSCDQSNAQLFDLILEIKSQNDQLLNEVKTLQLKSDLLIAELRISAAKQEELLTKVTDLQNQLSSILSQIAILNKQLENQNTDLQEVKDKLAELQTQYQGIVVQLQELQKLSQILAEIEKLKAQLKDLDAKYLAISPYFNNPEIDTLEFISNLGDTQVFVKTHIALLNSSRSIYSAHNSTSCILHSSTSSFKPESIHNRLSTY